MDDPEYWRKRAEETWSLAEQKTEAQTEMIMAPRSVPPPWSAEDTGVTYVIKDSSGQNLAYICCEEEAGRRASKKILSKGEARRIAFFGNLPELLRKV